MTYDALVDLAGDPGWFEFATLAQMTEERRQSLQVQIHRWKRSGKVLPLRRGMYALPERYRKKPLVSAELANRLYAPSYLSTYWALGYYGMIPEHVPQFTSVTQRKPGRFENDFGVFAYRNLKAEAFFGYKALDIAGARVLVAEPEKALLDLWHLEKGAWNRSRLDEMRFHGFELVDPKRLKSYGDRFHSPRIGIAVSEWLKLVEADDEGVEL